MAKTEEKTEEMSTDEAIEVFVKSLKREWPANYAAYSKRFNALLVKIGEDDACTINLLELATGEIKFNDD